MKDDTVSLNNIYHRLTESNSVHVGLLYERILVLVYTSNNVWVINLHRLSNTISNNKGIL